MRFALVCVVAVLVGPFPSFAVSPAEALAVAKSRIASGDCHGAIAVLEDTFPAAAALTAEKTRADALGALHFYSALAFSNCNLPAKAKEHIREFLRFHPGYSSLDANKYPPAFRSLFEETQRAGNPTAFSHHYQEYNSSAAFSPEQEPLVRWGASAAFQLLADEEERQQWPVLQDDVARTHFVEAFWAKRDKEEIQRRIAFADRLWSTGFDRGALTDRGRVFVLLGIPARVYSKPLTRADGAFIPSRSPVAVDGQLERWIYFKDQLPAAIRTTAVEFRFITQAGYGDHVMQKDLWPMKALAEAQRKTAASR